MGILRSDRITGLGGANAITGSCFFDVKNYLFINYDISLDGDFTIEWWTHRNNGVTNSDWFTIGDAKESSGLEVYIGSSGSALKVYSNNGTILTANSGSPSQNAWHHMAVVRSSNTIKIYVDGTVDSTTVSNSSTFTGFIRLGAEFYNGSATIRSRMHMSNFRIVKGTALYTSNFTPPNTRLESITGTEVLCCQSSGNILQEATGKTIVAERAANALTSSNVEASRFTPNSPVGFSTTTDVGTQFGSTFDGFGLFATSTYMVPPGGNTRERNRGRGVMSGGETPSRVNTITFTHIQSSGNFQDFGDLIGGDAGETRGVGSSTRGVFFTNHGGSSGQAEDLEFITFANQSNGTDFGDLPTDHPMRGSAGNETRGIFAGGYKLSLKNEIEFITIATTGNGTDFGNLTGTRNAVAGLASPTRALFGGGSNPSNINNIDIVTIATTGDASDFGDLTRTGKEMGGVASNTRGVFAGARINPSTASNVIDFVTIASAGNAIDFGDLTQIVASPASMTDSIRGLFAGGYTPTPSFTRFNSIDFINIATTGNASDFGDLTYAQNYGGGCSDSHGGL